MSEIDRGGVTTIGERLRAAREAKNMTLAEVASKTRIPIRHLQHIEDGEWNALPAPTYSVGFARSYANAIGLNGNEIGAELRQQIGSPRPTYDTPPSYYEPADPARVPPRSLAMIAGGIALLLIAAYLIWRSMSVDSVDPEVSVTQPPPAAAPVQNQPATQQTASATGPVVLTATEEVWMRVYEGNGGPTIFEGIMKAGQRFEVPATAQAPQIRTGRPQALRVTVGATAIPPLGQPEQTIRDVSLRAADLAARANAPQPAAPSAAVPNNPQPQR